MTDSGNCLLNSHNVTIEIQFPKNYSEKKKSLKYLAPSNYHCKSEVAAKWTCRESQYTTLQYMKNDVKCGKKDSPGLAENLWKKKRANRNTVLANL